MGWVACKQQVFNFLSSRGWTGLDWFTVWQGPIFSFTVWNFLFPYMVEDVRVSLSLSFFIIPSIKTLSSCPSHTLKAPHFNTLTSMMILGFLIPGGGIQTITHYVLNQHLILDRLFSSASLLFCRLSTSQKCLPWSH